MLNTQEITNMCNKMKHASLCDNDDEFDKYLDVTTNRIKSLNLGINKTLKRTIKKKDNPSNPCRALILNYEDVYKNDPTMEFVGERITAGDYFVGRCGKKYFHLGFKVPNEKSG